METEQISLLVQPGQIRKIDGQRYQFFGHNPPQLTEALLEDLYDSHKTRKRQATDALGKDKGRKKYQKIDYSKVTVNVKW